MGLTAVYNAINQCNFEKMKTQMVVQTDLTNVVFRQARFNWIAQFFLVQMGETLPDNDESDVRPRLKDEWIDYDELKNKNLTTSSSQ